MKLEPVGYIGIDAFEAISCGESIQPTMTPKVVCEDDAPLYAIPPGYVLVKAEPDEAMIRAGLTKMADGGSLSDIYKAMIEGEQ